MYLMSSTNTICLRSTYTYLHIYATWQSAHTQANTLTVAITSDCCAQIPATHAHANTPIYILTYMRTYTPSKRPTKHVLERNGDN